MCDNGWYLQSKKGGEAPRLRFHLVVNIFCLYVWLSSCLRLWVCCARGATCGCYQGYVFLVSSMDVWGFELICLFCKVIGSFVCGSHICFFMDGHDTVAAWLPWYCSSLFAVFVLFQTLLLFIRLVATTGLRMWLPMPIPSSQCCGILIRLQPFWNLIGVHMLVRKVIWSVRGMRRALPLCLVVRTGASVLICTGGMSTLLSVHVTSSQFPIIRIAFEVVDRTSGGS